MYPNKRSTSRFTSTIAPAGSIITMPLGADSTAARNRLSARSRTVTSSRIRCASWRSILSDSVRSSEIIVNPMGLPFWSRRNVIVTCARKVEPSLRTRVSAPDHRPVLRASSRISRTLPLCTSSGACRTLALCPVISAASYP